MSELGQFIITGVCAETLSQEERKFLEEENIGGVILFSHNYSSPAQLAELVNSIQQARQELPLFIAVDHEGGRVQRFKSHFLHFPPMLEISKLNSPKITFEVHRIMAEELIACGVNVNFSPVCDVWTNPNNKVIGDRAFGDNPDEVSKHITAAIRGLQTHGVIACAKHFPGHGSTSKDSHFDLPYVTKSLEELLKLDLPPFIKAVKSRVEMVMMGHLVVDALDKDNPCSLSKNAHQYLRNELKFNRLIVSDDMEMKAIADNNSFEDAAIRAFVAGTDILIYRSMEKAKLGLEGLKRVKKDKIIKVDEITQKLNLVNTCKKTYLADYSPLYIPSITKEIGKKGNEKFLQDLLLRISNT